MLHLNDAIYPIPSEADKVIVQLSPTPGIFALIPAKKRKIRALLPFAGSKDVELKSPRLVWRLPLDASSERTAGERISLRALNARGDMTGLYLLANVHDDGRICWGEGDEPESLKAAHNRFWSAPFNADLWEPYRDHGQDDDCEAGTDHECADVGRCERSHDCRTCRNEERHKHECERLRNDERCEPDEHDYGIFVASTFDLVSYFLGAPRQDGNGADIAPTPEDLAFARERLEGRIRDTRLHLDTPKARREALAQGLAPEGWDASKGCWCQHCVGQCSCPTGCACCDNECDCLDCECARNRCECSTGCACCDNECDCRESECRCNLSGKFAEHLATYRPALNKRAKRWMEGFHYVSGKGQAVLVSTDPKRLAAHPDAVTEFNANGETCRYLVAFGERTPDGAHEFRIGKDVVRIGLCGGRGPVSGCGATLRIGDMVRSLRPFYDRVASGEERRFMAGEILPVASVTNPRNRRGRFFRLDATYGYEFALADGCFERIDAPIEPARVIGPTEYRPRIGQRVAVRIGELGGFARVGETWRVLRYWSDRSDTLVDMIRETDGVMLTGGYSVAPVGTLPYDREGAQSDRRHFVALEE